MGVYDEELWKLLESKAAKEDEGIPSDRRIAHGYLNAVQKVCDYGIERAITIRDTFPMYTKHDETHICNVLRIMWDLLGSDENRNRLTMDEAATLVLAACCHDVGMSYEEEDRRKLLEEDLDGLNQYLDEHPAEYVKAYKSGSDKPELTDEMVRSYFRSIHPNRAASLLHEVGWPTELDGRVDVETVAEICRSHGNDVATLVALESTDTIDSVLCAILLRLADILDFDTSRAPSAVYYYCGFDRRADPESVISRAEWAKHMSSHGFSFRNAGDRSHPYELPYTATCRSMQIEQAINSYLDWVDREFLGCGKERRLLSDRWRGFVLPAKVARRIVSRGYVSGQFRFTLDQDRVIDLLVGDDLYGDSTVFVRELIQNAIDAVRTRQQLDKDPHNTRSWKPQINIHTWMDDEGYHWFRIEDNGIGMTESVIMNHLLKVGSSYYTSSAFEREKIRRNADPGYTPISRFGVGLLSCFMGDMDVARVEISTKHYEGSAPALRLRMDGRSGYYYLANQKMNHNPGPMQGKKPVETRKYRNEPGTAIAVRTNLYLSGRYGGFKEIVDKYVLYPPVPIHYEGGDGVFDYPTQQEFMDAIHAIHPSDNLAEEGLLEIPVPDGKLREIQKVFPEFTWHEPLKVKLKVFAFDRYTDCRHVSGAAVMAWAVGSLSSFIVQEGSAKVSFTPRIVLVKPEANTNTTSLFRVRINLKISDSFYESSNLLERYRGAISSLRSSLASHIYGPSSLTSRVLGFSRIRSSQEWLKFEILERMERRILFDTTTAVEYPDDLKEVLLQVERDLQSTAGFTEDEYKLAKFLYNALDNALEYENTLIDVEQPDWYRLWFNGINANEIVSHVCVHNGVICGSTEEMYASSSNLYQCASVLLLADSVRPSLGLKRDEIRGVSLENRLILTAMLKKMQSQGCLPSANCRIFSNVKDARYRAAKEYADVLRENSDLKEAVVIEVKGVGPCSIDDARLLLERNTPLEIHGIADLKELSPESPYSFRNRSEELFSKFCMYCLQQEFDVYGSQKESSTLTIRKKDVQKNDCRKLLFPPLFFVKLDSENSSILTMKSHFYRRWINESNPLSVFLLENAMALKERMPGLFQEFVRNLAEEDGTKLVDNVNDLLARIRSCEGSNIVVPDNVFLTEDNLF